MATATEREYLTVEQALAMLPDGKHVHTFRDSGLALIGADWTRKEIIKAITNADTREIGGEQCTAMKHGLVLMGKKLGTLFVATR